MESIVNGYNYLFFEATDQRSNDWILYGHPYKILAITILYVWFALKGGPAFMKNRQPFKIEGIISIYNLFQVVACGYLWIRMMSIYFGPNARYNLTCNPLNFEDTPEEQDLLLLGYIYVWLKLLDMMDTVFFVLRKKQSHITFLHVYHHALMWTISAMGHRYIPNGTGAYLVLVNCFVHTVMYFYYFLASRDSSYRNVWWKKYLTALQIAQFLSIFVVFVLTLIDPDCSYPKKPLIGFLPQPLVFTYLFSKFYIKTYINNPKKSD